MNLNPLSDSMPAVTGGSAADKAHLSLAGRAGRFCTATADSMAAMAVSAKRACIDKISKTEILWSCRHSAVEKPHIHILRTGWNN